MRSKEGSALPWKKNGKARLGRKKSLQILIFTIIAVTFIGLIMTTLLILQAQILSGFTAVERQSMTLDMDQAVALVHDQAGQLDTVAGVWAATENTRLVLESPDKSLILSRFPDDKFATTKINAVIILDREGNIIAHKYYSLESSRQLPTPRSLLSGIESLPPGMLSRAQPGILDTESGPVIFAARAVPDENKTTLGYLVVTRNLDTIALRDLSNIIGYPVTVHRIGNDPPRGESGVIGESALTAIATTDATVTAYCILPDIAGNDSYYIEMSSPRPAQQMGRTSLNYIFVSLLITGIIFEAMVLVLLEYYVISRITSLDREVRHIGEHGNVEERVIPWGNDEITSLAESVNSMLSSLEQSRKRQIESELRYAHLLDTANDCIFTIQQDGSLVSCNRQIRAFAKATSTTLKEGGNLSDMTTDETRAELHKTLQSGLNNTSGTGGTHSFELEITAPDQRIYTLEVDAQQTGVVAGSIVEYFCIARDITERKDYESRLLAANRKLQVLGAVTRDDIKSQLNVLSGYIGILRIKERSPDAQKAIEKIENVVGKILTQVEFTGDYQDLGIRNAQWQDLLITFKLAISHLSVLHLRQVINIAPVEILVDPLFEKALVNLVENSIKYGGHVTEIRLNTEVTGKDLVVVYEDYGVGIPEGDKERIFNHDFNKVAGFGLFLTREILSITGITIRETGIPGEGARFEILVPKGSFRYRDPDS